MRLHAFQIRAISFLFVGCIVVGCGPSSDELMRRAAKHGKTRQEIIRERNPGISFEKPGNCDDGFVFRAGFETADGLVVTGTAFALALSESGHTVMMSADHIFRSAERVPRDMPVDQRADVVHKIGLNVAQADSPIEFATAVLPLDYKRRTDELPDPGRLLGFRVPDDADLPTAPLRLEWFSWKEDRIWLVVPPADGESGARVYGAVHGKWNPGVITYEFDRDLPKDVIADACGAPLCDNQGKVVGVHVGLEPDSLATSDGFGIPLYAIVDEIRDAAGVDPLPLEPPTMTLSDDALEKLQSAMTLDPEATHVVVALDVEDVVNCVGFEYRLTIEPKPSRFNYVFLERQGIQLAVEREHVRLFDGTTLDYVSQPSGVEGFLFRNPNATSPEDSESIAR